MKKVYLLCSLLLLKFSLSAQVSSINLQAIHACGGATLVPFVIWTDQPVPLTINYERQGAAGTWFTVVSQVYVPGNSYIVVSPTDISSATNYRIRAVDGNFTEFFSNGTVVNPAIWNVNRGAANVILNSYWGTSCSNNENQTQVSINYLTNGRPPFRVEYKRVQDANFILAGEAVGFFSIMGILPNTAYNVRVTDYCGNVSTNGNTSLGFLSAATMLQDATTCNDGRIQLGGGGDARFSGIPPYEYGIGKVTAGLGSNLPPFVYQAANTFENLGPGDYYLRLRDQCGNLSNTSFIRLGGGFPRVSGTASSQPGNDCARDVTVNVTAGDGPFEYAIKYIQDAQFGGWQTSNLFANLNRSGVYFIKAKDKCGSISDSVPVNIGQFPTPVIDSVRHTSLPGCAQNIRVYASGGFQPYEYSRDFFNWKATDTFNNFEPGIYNFWVRDRCGRVTNYTSDTIPVRQITVYTSSGLDSCGASTGYLSVDSIINGVAPYQYAIRNMAAPGTAYSTFMSDSIFRNLPPGEYSIRVKDACYAEDTIDNIKVGSPFTFTYDLSPNVGCSPFLTINLHNAGQAPYTYFITNGTHKRKIESNDSTVSLTDLPNGDYTITITNACGDTADLVGSPLTINLSGAPQITYEVQYINNCFNANIIVHGAPEGSTYQLWHILGGVFEQNDSVFTNAQYNITGGKYYIVVYNNAYCGFNTFHYGDTVQVANITTLMTGTVDMNKPDSFCIYNPNSIRLNDYLENAEPGGSWLSTVPWAFDIATALFSPSVAGAGEYEFTYSIIDPCGGLHETTVRLYVSPDVCQVRAIVGDYHSIVQPQGCPEINGGFQNFDYTDNQGNLLFTINPMGRDLANVCAGVRVVDGNGTNLRSAVIDGRTTYFLDRNFYIQSPNGFSGNGPVIITLYFTDEEIQNMLNFLHNNGYPAATVNDLRIMQKSGDDEDLSVTNEALVNPLVFVTHTPNIYQTANHWVMQFEVYNFSEFIPHFTGANVGLPLRLIDFTGSNRQNQVRLNWTTADENNTSHFDIERSNNGNTFQSIGRINAAGNSSVEKLYAFDDVQPLTSNNFYRLKMVDLDGKYTYSKTIMVRPGKLTNMKLTPNPARDHLYISIPENTKARAIRIYDASGRLLYHERTGGNQPLRVSTAQLRNGWYMLELQTEQGSMREAFIKQ